MMKKNEYPKCLQEHHDCFANVGLNLCDCLINTDFGDRQCPFYKRSKDDRPTDSLKEVTDQND